MPTERGTFSDLDQNIHLTNIHPLSAHTVAHGINIKAAHALAGEDVKNVANEVTTSPNASPNYSAVHSRSLVTIAASNTWSLSVITSGNSHH